MCVCRYMYMGGEHGNELGCGTKCGVWDLEPARGMELLSYQNGPFSTMMSWGGK